jgi:hypothetical protein
MGGRSVRKSGWLGWGCFNKTGDIVDVFLTYSRLQKGWRSPLLAFENKQNKTDPRLGFAPPEARRGMVCSQGILEFVIIYFQKCNILPKCVILGSLRSLLSQSWLSSDPSSMCSDHTVWHRLCGENHYLGLYMIYIRNNWVAWGCRCCLEGQTPA